MLGLESKTILISTYNKLCKLVNMWVVEGVNYTNQKKQQKKTITFEKNGMINTKCNLNYRKEYIIEIPAS